MLPKCRYFRDMAWTLRSEGNGTLQTVHCHCPKGSVAYLLKRQAYQLDFTQVGYQYSFACSPQSVSSWVRHRMFRSIRSDCLVIISHTVCTHVATRTIINSAG